MNVLDIFKNKRANEKRLVEYGFKKTPNGYVLTSHFLEGQFSLTVTVDGEGISARLTDVFTGDEYTLHLVDDAMGAFVGSVRTEFLARLTEIRDKCFEADDGVGDYARAVMEYIRGKYGDEPEFLWEKTPTNAIWRRKDNSKWYCVLITLARRKLGLDEDGFVEILDLQSPPECIAEIVDGKRYFKGYHMNKKHWMTVCLDGSLPFKEICKRIDESYLLAKDKKALTK